MTYPVLTRIPILGKATEKILSLLCSLQCGRGIQRGHPAQDIF